MIRVSIRRLRALPVIRQKRRSARRRATCCIPGGTMRCFTSAWDSLQQQGRWQGEIWNRHKNGIRLRRTADHCRSRDAGSGRNPLCRQLFRYRRRQGRPNGTTGWPNYDPLTRLPNRRLLQDRLGQVIAASGAAAATVRCFSSIWTISRRSTIPAATMPATCCWSKWRSACRLRARLRYGGAPGRRILIVVLLDNLSSDVEKPRYWPGNWAISCARR